MKNFADRRTFLSADAFIEFAALHDCSFRIETNPPEHRVSGENHRIAALFEIFVHALVGFPRPILAVAVDHQNAVTDQLPRIAVQVQIGDNVKIIAVLLQPDLSESLGPHQMAVTGGLGTVEHVGPRSRPGHAQALLETRLSGVMPPVIGIGRRERMAVFTAVRSPRMIPALVDCKRCGTVGQPGIGRTKHQNWGLGFARGAAHDERDVIQHGFAIQFETCAGTVDA